MKTRTILTLIASLTLVHGTSAQSTRPAADILDFGTEGLTFPAPVLQNVHTARTADLLGEAYRRKDPVVWQRVRYIADLGQVALPAAAPYVSDAIKDPAAEVRGEAARSARLIDYAALLPAVEKLLADPDATVRREAVFAAASLARSHEQTTAAITSGLSDEQPAVVAAAIQAAWLPDHAAAIAQKLPTLPPDLKPAAAESLARLKASDHAPALLPLLGGDVVQRSAAVRAIGDLAATSALDAVLKLLDDPHPTVRRQAITTIGKLLPAATREPTAVGMLNDPDRTVRQAAAVVLTPVPSPESLAPLAAQLDEDYTPLHRAAREALSHPGNPAVRDAAIQLAAGMLGRANPRRREDASHILGRLRSDAAIDPHVALLQFDPADPLKSDWPLIAQAAESLGLIGNARAIPLLMSLVKAAPDAITGTQEQRRDMGIAMGNALAAAARLRHRPALDDAGRIIDLNPEGMSGHIRAAAAFAVGVLSEPSPKPPHANQMIPIYENIYEDPATKFEALKALGNLRHAPLANRLKTISESDPTPMLRYIAHWSYQRAANTTIPYTPPPELRDPPVTITDLTR